MARINSDVLVIGGGVTGAQVALDLAKLGLRIALVERNQFLGGISKDLYRTYPFCFCCRIPPLLEETKACPNISIYYDAQVVDIDGEVGNFRIRIADKQGQVAFIVRAVVLAMGLEPNMDPAVLSLYHYGECSNVVTGVEFEEWLKSKKNVLPNGKRPQRIAWLQCIGSRDEKHGYGYCSSVCCMYALKQAVNVKERFPEAETAIFYIDLRTYGRFYEAYLKKAEALGVRCIQSRISFLKPCREEQEISISYVDREGIRRDEAFDLVVLSVGLKPRRESLTLAKRLSLKLNRWNFIETHPLSPVKTSKEGIYICGALQEPKDIYESLIQASAVACEIAGWINQDVPEKRFEPLKNQEENKIGLIWLDNFNNNERIGQKLKEKFSALSGVAFMQVKDIFNKRQRQKLIDFVTQNNITGFVFAGFSHRLDESALKELARGLGVSPYACEIVNLEYQCFNVHSDEEQALKKAMVAVSMAMARLNISRSKRPMEISVIKSGLVVGAGLTGLLVARELSQQGFKVDIVDKNPNLGESLFLESISNIKNTEAIKNYIHNLLKAVEQDPSIQIHLGTQIVSSSGVVGNFRTLVRKGGTEFEIKHGVTFITGYAQEANIDHIKFGKDPRIVSINNLSQMAQDRLRTASHVAIIQCVGSRCEEYPFCSRICCVRAMIYALKIKEINPKANIYVFYRDIRTYGFAEALYRKAREAGVSFIPFEGEIKIERTGVGALDNLNVFVKEALLQKEVIFPADLVILNTGIWPSEENKNLSKIFKVPLAEDGFFKPSTEKMKPVETNKRGVFICGLATGPKLLSEHIVSAKAAVAKALPILKNEKIENWSLVAKVDKDKCDGCGYCVDVCPFGAIHLIEYPKEGEIKKMAQVDEGTCQGCGICQATCPKEGIYVENFSLTELRAMIDAALRE